MSPFLADGAPAADLLDVFNSYDGSVVFRGLTESVGGQPPVLGSIGWIFTGFGALFALWGFVLRAQRSGAEGKMAEIAKTWVVIAFMLGGPFLMRAAMQGADSVYATSPGSPQNITTACVKAALAMPELNQFTDMLRHGSIAGGSPPPGQGGPQQQSLTNSSSEGSPLGYLEALGVNVWNNTSDFASGAAQTWSGMVRLAAMAAAGDSVFLKWFLIAMTILPLYLLLLCAAAIVWFMVQLRYFLAVSGTMMLPLFTGMFSLPEGHFNRQAAQGYVMHMVSLALWPVAWAIGHTGTISLYNALISLIAGTSRVPDLAAALQWSSITSGSFTDAQVQATDAALGNWFMGNLTALLAILVGGLGFVMWVVIVSILGPAFLHKLLATGALFATQASGSVGQYAMAAGKLALDKSEGKEKGGLGFLMGGKGPVGPLNALPLAQSKTQNMPESGGGGGDASMADASRLVAVSDGKAPPPL
jgi:hypothetical protein